MYKTFYKSDLKELEGREFQSVKELEKAEAEVCEKAAAKQKAVEARKAKAETVKQAIVARVDVETEAAKEKREAYKAYLEACDAADKKVAEKKKLEKEELRKFCEEYGSFHDTITIGDATYNVSYSESSTTSRVDPFERLLSMWF